MAKPAFGRDFLVGRVLGHYRIVERIGQGGMGIVYRALDEHLDNREVAIKILPQGSLADDASRQRFRKEAHALSKLNHPNIASVIDFDSCDGIDYLAEEFVAGISLEEMLATGPLPEKEVISHGSQLCEGLAAAHEHDILHRDIKPGNIRVTPEAHLKILDFGLAKTLHTSERSGSESATLSETQIVTGTLPYMSPEQLRNEKLDGRTDIWAAGCVLYEMMTGRRPFLGSGPALIDAILRQPAPATTKVNPKISKALDAVVQKCLEKDPEKRYYSAREIAVDLRRTLSAPISASMRLQWRRWFTAPATAVAVVVLLIVGVLVKTSLQRSASGKSSAVVTAPLKSVPHESYLSGLKRMERWDKAGNIDRAIADFQQAINADRDFALGYSGLAEAYWAKYRLDHNPQWIDQAEANCRRAAELNDQLPAVYVTLARLHNGKGEYNLALQEIQQALKLEPGGPDALLGQASIYASMGRMQDAESTFKKAAALRPQYWGAHYEFAGFYYRHKRYADAAAEFRRVVELIPDNALAHATLGAVLQLLNENDRAEKELKWSLELQPSYAAYTNLGALYYRERRWAESAAMTQNALAINSNDYAAWANLGMAYEWLNEPNKAEKAYQQELTRLEELATVKEDNADLQAELSVLYARKKQREKAIPRIEAALARAPEDPGILAAAAETHEYLGERSRALEFVKKALANGWTLAQLKRAPGLRNLILDPKFQSIQSNSKQSSSAKPVP